MNITITVPVRVDEPVTEPERDKLKKYLEASFGTSNKDVLRSNLGALADPETRMLGTVCRFSFGRPEVKVE